MRDPFRKVVVWVVYCRFVCFYVRERVSEGPNSSNGFVFCSF